MNVLDALGLRGSHQVHLAPMLLQVDLRAHQVFVGFSDLTPIRSAYRHIAPEFVPCWVESRGETAAADLHGIDRWPKGATLVVPALNHEHPGGFYGLVWVVDRLLGPGGCPWDQAQTHESLKRFLVEEAYELFDAIDANDDEGMREELGDVVLQPLMQAQIRKAAGGWDIDEAVRGITDKLIRRHPHVFGDTQVNDADDVLKNWDAIKKQEKAVPMGLLSGIPTAMPSLHRALEISKRAARAGFEWPDMDAVWEKVDEETAELKEALASKDVRAIESEVGDLLFTVVNIARWAKVEPEEALRTMLNRFSARFAAMERSSDKPLTDISPEEWDTLWKRAKAITGP